jgi:putative membrane protein
MKTLRYLFLVAVPVVLLSCNSNPNKNSDKTSTTSEGDMTVRSNNAGKDDDFVKEASSGGMMEVELGKYAEQNALSQRVKNFGAMMVRDHTKANEELKSLATSKNLDLQGSMDDTHFEKVSDLQKKRGADFDKEYMKSMVDDHQEDIDEFKKQAENGSDPELKAFAAKTLPVLQAHLDSAKNIQKALK